MRAYIYDTKTLKRKDMFNILEYEINVDYVSDPVSLFKFDREPSTIEIGDLIEIDSGIIQQPKTELGYTIQSEPVQNFKPFFGVVSSLDEGFSCSAVNIYNLFRMRVRFESITSLTDLLAIINSVLLQTNEYNLPQIISSNLPQEYPPFAIFEQGKKFSTAILRDLIIDIYKRANIVMICEIVPNFNGIEGRAVRITFKYVDEVKQIRNNVDTFQNWELNYSAASTKSSNKVTIVDKDSGKNLANYWATNLGQVVSVFDENEINTPVINEFVEHDTEKEYDEEALNAIGGYRVVNSIKCDVDLFNNHIISIADIKIGTLFDIQYNGMKFKTYLSGYMLKSGTPFVTLLFGYERETLQNLLRRN